MQRTIRALAIFCACALLIGTAEAKPRHHKHHHIARADSTIVSGCEFDNNGRQICRGPNQRIQGRLKVTRLASSNPVYRAGLVTVDTAAGIRITVNAYYADQFRALIADLVREGHKPRFITCYALGHKSGSNHAWGGACDIDQTAWGRTSGFMYHASGTIKANGLYDGCHFGDCGHVEAVRGLHNQPPNLYAAVAKFKSQQ